MQLTLPNIHTDGPGQTHLLAGYLQRPLYDSIFFLTPFQDISVDQNIKSIWAVFITLYICRIFPQRVEWAVADSMCESFGGGLPEITSDEENDALVQILTPIMTKDRDVYDYYGKYYASWSFISELAYLKSGTFGWKNTFSRI